MSTDTISLKLTAQDGLSAILKGAENQLSSLSRTADTVRQKLGMTNEQLISMGAALGASSAAVGALAYKMQSTLSGWAESGKNLEVALTNLKYNAQATEEEFKRISDRVMETGRNSLYSATQATEAMYELMSFGLQGAIDVTDEAGRHFKRKTAEMALDATLNYATMTHGLVSLADAAKLSGAMVQKAHLDMSKVSYDEEGNMITQLDRMYDKVSKASILTGLKPEDMPAIMNSARAAISMVNMDLSTALAMVGQLKSSGMDNAESGNKLVEYARKAADLGAKYLTTDMYAHIRAAMGKDPMKGATTMLGKRQTYWLDTVFGSRSEFEKALSDESGNFRDPLEFMQILDKKMMGLGYSRVKTIETLRKMFGTTESMQMFLTFAEQASFTPSENIYAVDEWGRKLDGVNEKLLYQKDITYKGIEAMLAYRYSVDASRGESQRYADMMKKTFWGEMQHFNALKDTVKSQYGKYVGELAVAVMRLVNGLMRFFSAIETNFPNVARAFTWLLVTLTAIGAALAVIGLPLAMISLAMGRFATIGHNLGRVTGIKFIGSAAQSVAQNGFLSTVVGAGGKLMPSAAASAGASLLSKMKLAGSGVGSLGAAVGIPKLFGWLSALTGRGAKSLVDTSDGLMSLRGVPGFSRFASVNGSIAGFSGVGLGAISRLLGIIGNVSLAWGASRLAKVGDYMLSSSSKMNVFSGALVRFTGALTGFSGVGLGLISKLSWLAGKGIAPMIATALSIGKGLFSLFSKFATTFVKPMIMFTGILSIFQGIFSLFSDSADKSKTWAQSFKDFFRDIGGATRLFKKALFSMDGVVTDEDIDAARSLAPATLKLIDNPVFAFFRHLVEFSHKVDKEFNDMIEQISKVDSSITGNKVIDTGKLKGAGLIGKGIGGIGGWLGGMAAATAIGMPFLGPILGMVFAFLGQWLGERFGKWVSVFMQAAQSPDGLDKISKHVQVAITNTMKHFSNMISFNSKELGKITRVVVEFLVAVIKGLLNGLVEMWVSSVEFAWNRMVNSNSAGEVIKNGFGFIFSFIPVFGEIIFQVLFSLLELIKDAFLANLHNPQFWVALIGGLAGGIGAFALTKNPSASFLAATTSASSLWGAYSVLNGGDEKDDVEKYNEAYAKWDNDRVAQREGVPAPYKYDSIISMEKDQMERQRAVNDAISNAVQGAVEVNRTTNNNYTMQVKVEGKNMKPEEVKALEGQLRESMRKIAAEDQFRNRTRSGDRDGGSTLDPAWSLE